MVGVTRIFKLVVLGRDYDPDLGTEYDQLAILNDDFTLNMEKLAQQVCLNALSTCTYKNDLFHLQGLPWYAASQLLYKVSRTLYIGGKRLVFGETNNWELTGENTLAALTHFFLWHSRTVYNIIRDSRVNSLVSFVVPMTMN